MSVPRLTLAALIASTLLAARPAQAQGSSSTSPAFFIEGLGGAVIPTFDIANDIKTGAMFGATVGYQLDPDWTLMAEFDYGHHKDKPTNSVTIKTLHYMAKLGYSLTGPRERGWDAMVNLGAGAVTFDGFGAAGTKTYFAINAGAKITYNFSPTVGFVISPQGDIAFSKKAEVNTTNAWVWPVSAGLRIKF